VQHINHSCIRGFNFKFRFLKQPIICQSRIKSINMNKVEEIKKLKSLLDQGAISEDEFTVLKKELLSQKTDFNKANEVLPPNTSNQQENSQNNSEEVIIEPLTYVKKPSKKKIAVPKNEESNDNTDIFIASGIVASLFTSIRFWVRFESFAAFIIVLTIGVAISLTIPKVVHKSFLKNLLLGLVSFAMLILLAVPIGNDTKSTSSTEVSEYERPSLYCKWCKKWTFGKPYENLYDYTIEPDGIGIIIFNTGEKFGYCSKECAEKGALAGFGYTENE